MLLDTMSCLERFAQAARTHIDLSARVKYASPGYVQVRNRFSERLAEHVTCNGNGDFVTSWGYRLGNADNVDQAAARLAYLLAALPAGR